VNWFFIVLPVYSSPDTCREQDLAPFFPPEPLVTWEGRRLLALLRAWTLCASL